MKKKGHGDRKDREDRHVIRRNIGGFSGHLSILYFFYGFLIFFLYFILH